MTETILNGLSDRNRNILLRASCKLDIPPEWIVDYLITKNIEAIIKKFDVETSE